ncbi:hypothetical protein ACFLR0_02630 [Candidatus Bipolaricaulota bacterium]
MKSFGTLLWLEHRRSWVWAVSLIGSLAFWAWGIKQVLVMDVGERFGIRAGLLGVAAMIGALILCLMIGRIRAETRHGQYQVLLLTPPNGYAHVMARYLYVKDCVGKPLSECDRYLRIASRTKSDNHNLVEALQGVIAGRQS